MIDLRAAVEQEARALFRSADAAVHRAGVDHEVMVGAVEPVTGKELDLTPQRIALVEIAGNHRQVGVGDQLRMLQQTRQRRAGQHRLEARQGARIGPLLEDRQQEIEQVFTDTVRHEILEHRQPAVEPAGSERRAARRTGDTDEAAHADGFGVENSEQLDQCSAVGCVGLVARRHRRFVERAQPELCGDGAIGLEQGLGKTLRERIVAPLAFAEAQQFADQTAARM
ncbi:MAG: hypothetical protein CAPSK01_004279 [Candidatus Accumulibacter vicinus]|uniref:Uncharacterized protein n=1 Tax=Candidatus Accumulibacter vicinus TaxID=2954382 RepID=A0A084XV96_9PROT|nr:MAG: hypothetical protein CAPSK01_004279 [Candidatus Accumulibacter vicinus]